MIASLVLACAQTADFQKELTQWRVAREKSLTAPTGWLSVAGLFWLKEGSASMGSAEGADVRLPSSAPADTAKVVLTDGKVSIRPVGDVAITTGGNPLPDWLMPDADGGTERIKIGDLTLAVIRRGKRIGLRLWDPNCQTRREFRGLKWFAPNERYVVNARFVTHKAGKTIPITNVLGDTELMPNPGYVEFRWAGKPCRLEAVAEESSLFFNFQDGTSGKETYAAGRFLYTDLAKDGFVTLDFNRAVNPPCAYTAFATCPLPPKGNRLPIRIEAGEKTPH